LIYALKKSHQILTHSYMFLPGKATIKNCATFIYTLDQVYAHMKCMAWFHRQGLDCGTGGVYSGLWNRNVLMLGSRKKDVAILTSFKGGLRNSCFCDVITEMVLFVMLHNCIFSCHWLLYKTS